MKRLVTLSLHLTPFAATATCAAWLLAYSPFAAPFVERTSAQIEAQLTRAMTRELDLAWLLPRIQIAILEQDLMQLDLLVGLANDFGVVLPHDMVDDIADLEAAASGFLARSAACGACAVDINSCETLSQIGTCALPFELTPAGDLNAIRRASVTYVEGGDIDRLDVGLAIVGLGATGAVLATGGTSYTLKAGTSVLRMARRFGTLTPALAARLTGLLGGAVRWDRFGDFARLRNSPREMVDSTKLGELSDLGGSLRRVADKTSVAETVSLLRYVDGTQDAARLARVSDALGPKTRGAFEVLGKTRVFRAVVRLSDLAISATLALYALFLNIMVFIAQQCGNGFVRIARRLIL